MNNKRLIQCALVVGVLLLTGCGRPPVCKSYSPYELDWHGYNSVITFKKYFGGYEQTILEHIGDTVKVYGHLYFKEYGMAVTPQDSRTLLQTFFDESGSGHVMYIQQNDTSIIEIPISFYDKTLYVTGLVVYEESMYCTKGTGLELISVDTIPQN